MFDGIRSRTDPRYRGDTYSRWDFGLALAQRAVEAGFLACVFFFLGRSVWGLGTAALPGMAGHVLGAALLVTAFALARVPAGLLRGELDRAFGIDARPLLVRAKAALGRFLFLLPVGTAGTAALYAALPVLGPLAWGLACLALVWLAAALWLMLPRLAILSAGNLRSPEPGEIPAGAGRHLALLTSGDVKLGPDDILVTRAFLPGLPAPFFMAGKIVVPEAALSGFPPGALEVRIIAAALARLVSAGRSLALLRFFSLALSAPASLILLNTAGIHLGYPLAVSPGLVGLVWAGAWGAFWFSELACLFVERSVSARIAATVAAVTLDARSLFESVDVMARANLDPARRTSLLDLFRHRQNPVSQFEAIKAAIQEIVESASRRRAGGGGPAAGGGASRDPAGRQSAPAGGSGAAGGRPVPDGGGGRAGGGPGDDAAGAGPGDDAGGAGPGDDAAGAGGKPETGGAGAGGGGYGPGRNGYMN
ncbi:MAG: hypothetical protein LBG06_12575 [Deltaproteobacteria bacterium]|jgi:hypothetical protein|nr:hypothetical protein [Deltaproteobacteria bacterium]